MLTSPLIGAFLKSTVMYPLVSIITPCTHDREHMIVRLTEMVNAQDYHNLEWLRSYSDGTVGAKRNELCNIAKGEIILHMDSDDTYSFDWISKSVGALITSGGNCTGLSKAYFKQGENWYLYQAQENAQPYVCGATMCYYRSLWERSPFRDIRCGEDLYFQTNAVVRPHKHIAGFTAIIHGNNTSDYDKILKCREFTPLPSGLAL